MKGLFPQLLGMFLIDTCQLFVLLWNYFSWGELSHPVLFHFPREFTANGSSLQGYKGPEPCLNLCQLWRNLTALELPGVKLRTFSWLHNNCIKSRVILCNFCFSFYYNLNMCLLPFNMASVFITLLRRRRYWCHYAFLHLFFMLPLAKLWCQVF